MVVAERGESGTRYRLLETLRQYGEERLDDRGETSAMRSAHLAYFADLAEHVYETWCGRQQRLAEAAYEAEWDNLRAAHSWAVSTNDPARADLIVSRTGSHAVWRLRHDHEDWGRRSTEIDGAGNPHRSMVLANLATWAFFHGEPVAAEEFAASAQAAAVDQEGVTFSTVVMFYALASAGRIDESAQHLPAIHAAMTGDGTIEARTIAAQAMVDASFGTDDAGAAVDWYTRLSEQMGEIQIARSKYMRGLLMLWGMDPPDLDGGIEAERAAIELAAEVDATEVLILAQTTLGHALTVGGRDGAREAVRSAVALSYDARYGMAVAYAVETAARYLASAGDIEGASVLLGHLDREPIAWSVGAKMRAELVLAVAGTEHRDQLEATGAAMDRRRAVEYALDRLDSGSR
jgi:hypothetical protein